MIVRIVRMEFQKDKVEDFKRLFEERKARIRSFPGCQYLELLQGLDSMNNVFMTYSYWESEKDLENYRYSDLFNETWQLTKEMFSQKPRAVSMEKIAELD